MSQSSSASCVHQLLEFAVADSDFERLEEQIRAVAPRLHTAEWRALLAAGVTIDPGVAAAEFQALVLRRWAQVDPRAAGDAVLALPVLNPELAISVVVGVWAESDLARAIAWARSAEPGDLRAAAMIAVAYEASRSQPDEAVRLARALSSSPAAEAVMVHAVAQWSFSDPAAAAAWSVDLPAGSTRIQVQSAIAQTWGERDPLAAMAFALEQMASGVWQDRAISGIALRWGQRAPVEVLTLLELLPEGALRQASLRNVMRLWSARDAAGAESWIKNLPTGESRARH